ncbi:hypothetical protein [Promicromonospora sp. NPDC023987]|uniref:hypothetical protein n=1 Tax=Promicromonospora sp. NPDC023987 TaxID=3155360 RepID=UPI003409F522
MNEQSVYGQPLVERRPLYRTVWLWVVLAVVLAMLTFGTVVVLFLTTDDPFGAEPDVIDCAKALADAGLETLPAAAEPECAAGGFQDAFVTIDFVAPRADVDAWLRTELPGTELQDEGCVDVDGCLQISYGEPDAPENGWTLDIETVDRADGTVAVAVAAYSL